MLRSLAGDRSGRRPASVANTVGASAIDRRGGRSEHRQMSASAAHSALQPRRPRPRSRRPAAPTIARRARCRASATGRVTSHGSVTAASAQTGAGAQHAVGDQRGEHVMQRFVRRSGPVERRRRIRRKLEVEAARGEPAPPGAARTSRRRRGRRCAPGVRAVAASAGHAPARPDEPERGRDRRPAARPRRRAGSSATGTSASGDQRSRAEPACPDRQRGGRQARLSARASRDEARGDAAPPPGAPRSAARDARTPIACTASQAAASAAASAPSASAAGHGQRLAARRSCSSPVVRTPRSVARLRLGRDASRVAGGDATARRRRPARRRLARATARSARWRSLDRPALARLRAQRKVDPASQLARQVATLAAQRRQMRAQPAGALSGRAAGPDRIDPGQRLVEHERQRVQVGRRRASSPSACSGAM